MNLNTNFQTFLSLDSCLGQKIAYKLSAKSSVLNFLVPRSSNQIVLVDGKRKITVSVKWLCDLIFSVCETY